MAIRVSSVGSRTRSADICLEVTCSPQAVEAVAEILRELGSEGVGIDGLSWPVAGDDVAQAPQQRGPARVFTIVPQEGATAILRAVREQLRRRVVPVFGGAQAALREAPREDWVENYRRSVRPAPLVPGIVVAPPWASEGEIAAAGHGARVLWIEPGAAFGTGDHESTRTTLRAGLRVLRAGDDVIDLGCGTGILGAAALLEGAGSLRAYDLDLLAAEAARRTLRRNGLRGRVRHGALPLRARAADLVFANLSGSALRPLLPSLARAVRPGGHAVLGGVLRADETFATACVAAGLRVAFRETEGDWQALCCMRP